ncbi:MAG: phosphosulfolactate synthase [Actinomycetota bacterium]
MSEHDEKRAFSFLQFNHRPPKPRRTGVTEVRGPYYDAYGVRHLEDVLETMGWYVDSVKFAGGSFALMPRETVKAFIDTAHRFDVMVSTGGFVEHVITRGPRVVERYIDECAEFGFDIVEISSGFISVPPEDLVRISQRVQKAGLKAKPEVGILFGAGGGVLEESDEGTRDVGTAISLAKRHLDAGAYIIMIESEGITENVRTWRTDAVARIAHELGVENVMFEAADPEVFTWYVKNYGAEVNLFVDHSQIVQLECLRSGLWGTSTTWGRIHTYREQS